ncbi:MULTISPECIES: hypothetical protein [Lonsdalea]|uniref:hypothetical protein n=1 Tax=Lonsdalea TaxID=1082702 RepID=UPI00111C7208|nr:MULTISPECIES: hypothetical protein [Lonsdalea]QPQ23441.1 hypothetical protein I6N93_12450 [Lonsdalea populi]
MGRRSVCRVRAGEARKRGCSTGRPPAGAARGEDGEHGNEQGACDCEPGAASAAGSGRGGGEVTPFSGGRQADFPFGVDVDVG